MRTTQALAVIDALQSSDWNREIFQSLVNSNVIAVHVTLAFWQDCRQTLSAIGNWNRHFNENADLILPVRSVDDIDLAANTGRTGIILGFQNSSSIEDELALVEIFHSLGIRIMQLTYNNQSLLGTGCYESADSGLTRFGKNVIREMNRLGMIIDVSHTSERTCLEAIEFSDRPIAVTHANPLTFENVVRNKSDKLLRSLADSGGMLGFSLYPLHLKNGSDCTLQDFCEMVAQTAQMIGVEHLGFGSDLCLGWSDEQVSYMRNGTWNIENASDDSAVWPAYPSWFQCNEDFPNIASGLQKAGFSDAEIEMIYSGNWYRFFERAMAAQ